MPDFSDLGLHVSVAGGLATCFERAAEVEAGCVQIFVKNQRQWAAKPLAPDEVEAFRAAHTRAAVATVVAHATYLVNLAAQDAVIWNKSILCLAEELRRAEALGLIGVVVHPGSSPVGREAGVARIAQAIELAMGAAPRGRPILEGMPGGGGQVGGRFEDLRAVIDALPARLRGRVGVALDTCHMHVAGYAVCRARDLEATLAELDAIVGLDRLAVLHMNDSKGARGSRLDRHANLGEGTIGRECFETIVNLPRLAGVPKILETPHEDDAHKRDLELLKEMRAAAGARSGKVRERERERERERGADGVQGSKRRPVRGG